MPCNAGASLSISESFLRRMSHIWSLDPLEVTERNLVASDVIDARRSSPPTRPPLAQQPTASLQ